MVTPIFSEEPDFVKNLKRPEFEFRDEAIPLIQYQPQQNSFDINPEAIDFLRKLDAPICIIGVAGMYRTGKSYLLNRILLDRKDGFGVGSTVNACTKGLWIWARPLVGQMLDGSVCNIVLVDSEGIGAVEEDQDHDTRIFALVVLISSYFLYNSIGAIDEEAIQSLSLVVNLTKHIQLKTKGDEEADSEDFAQYFPSFMWILRDFSLQLIDENGDTISQKEYLEKILQTQKGFSDVVEEKNRIRRLLKSFFQDRDCYCLVRPTTQEEKLQNLSQIELDELRPEFVEQVLSFRQNILQRAQPKALNNKLLNGEMIGNLILSYIDAINTGAIPSIESAWNYICKNECGKALENALEIYQKGIVDRISDRFPLNTVQLHKCHLESKKISIEEFNKIAIGSKDEFIGLLKQRISEKYQSLKAENEDEAQQQFNEFLQQNYQLVDKKLQNNEFQTFLEYERDLRAFQQYFLEHGPDGPNKNEYLLNFCVIKLAQASDYFIREINEDLQSTKQFQKQRLQKVEDEYEAYKKELLGKIDYLQSQLTLSDSEKAELVVKESTLREQLEIMREEKQTAENELRETLRNVRNEQNKNLEQANSRAWELEDQMKDMERQLYKKESEYQQKYELLENKVKYLEESLADSRKREKDYQSQLKATKSEGHSAIKDISLKHEAQIQELMVKIEDQHEKLAELEQQIEDKDILLEKQNQIRADQQAKLNEKIQQQKDKIQQLQEEIEGLDEDYQQKIQDETQENRNTIKKLRARLEETEKKLKHSEEVQISDYNTFESDKAIMLQKIQFLEQYLEESKSQLEEERKQHGNITEMLKKIGLNQSQEDLELQLNRLRDQYATDIRDFENVNSKKVRELKAELDRLNSQYDDLDLKYRIDIKDLEQKNKNLKQEIEDLYAERENLVDKIRILEELGGKGNNQKLQQQIYNLEQQLEDVQQQNTQEILAINQKSEATLQQLKNYYEQEKARIEQRSLEERQRQEQKYNAAQLDFEDKIRQEMENYDRIERDYSEQLDRMEAHHQDEIQSLRLKSSSDDSKIKVLEGQIHDLRAQIDIMQKNHKFALDQLNEKHELDKNAHIQKIDTLQSKMFNYEKQIQNLLYENDKLQDKLENFDLEVDELKRSYEREKQALYDKLDQAKEKYQNVWDEYTKSTSNFQREIALKNQSIEFLNDKIRQLEETYDIHSQNYNQTIQQLKDKSGFEQSVSFDRIQSQKQLLEDKLNKKKESFKWLQSQKQRTINTLEKENSQIQERLNSLESQYNELQQKYTIDVENLQQIINQHQDNSAMDKVNLQLENDRLKVIIQENDKENQIRMSNYDRDKILWENKFNFLLQQRDQARNELQEASKKFQTTLDQLQQSGIDKNSVNQTQSLIQGIEQRYTTRIQELQTQNYDQQQQYQQKVKELQSENKGLREMLELEKRNRNNSSESLEKRVRELISNEARIKQQLEEYKTSHTSREDQQQQMAQSQKSQYLSKIALLEAKASEAEQNRGELLLQLEKEKIKWSMEREQMIGQRNQDRDLIENLTAKSEQLVRELEKLKLERPSSRRIGSLQNSQEISQGIQQFLSPSAGIGFESFAKGKLQQQEGSRRPPRRNTRY